MSYPRKTEYDGLSRQELLTRGLSKQRVSQVARRNGQTREGEAEAVRREILRIADGSLTFADIGTRVSRSPESVKWIVHHLRAAGHKVKIRRKGT